MVMKNKNYVIAAAVVMAVSLVIGSPAAEEHLVQAENRTYTQEELKDTTRGIF